MKYFKQKYILLLAFILTATSCTKNFLDVENTEQLFRQSYVKDLNSMQQFMNGNYVQLSWYIEDGNTNVYPELIADNVRPLDLTSTLMIPHYKWAQISDGKDFQTSVGIKSESKAMDALWRMGYKLIRACNFVIEDVDKYRKENPSKADDLKGQALALRAYMHFKLVNTFAQGYSYTTNASHLGVPYVTTSDITESFIRQTVAEVYDGIINDLTSAIKILPSTVNDTRVMNHNAANAFLARMYLFKEDFINAKKTALEVVSKIPLMTISEGYPHDMFKLRAPEQTESLFQLSPKSSGYTTNYLGRYVRTQLSYVATSDLAIILKENSNDIRSEWIKDTTIGNSVFRLIRKFPTGVAPEVNPTVSPEEIAYYPVIIRSSEMFLTAAEASARLGDENTAIRYLDEVRKRADPNVAPLTSTGSDLLDSVYKERRKELAFESLRMYDLQRWKKAVQRNDILVGSPDNLPYPSDKAIAPIPLQDRQLAGIPPNPGY